MCVSIGAPKKPEYGPCRESHSPTGASWNYNNYSTNTASGTTTNWVTRWYFTSAGTSNTTASTSMP